MCEELAIVNEAGLVAAALGILAIYRWYGSAVEGAVHAGHHQSVS
jgi:hypothetical protein